MDFEHTTDASRRETCIPRKQSSQFATPERADEPRLVLESIFSPSRLFFQKFDMYWYPLLRFSRDLPTSNPFFSILLWIDFFNLVLPMLNPSTQQYSKQVKMITLHESWDNRSIVYSNIKYMSLLRLNCKWLETFFLSLSLLWYSYFSCRVLKMHLWKRLLRL